MVYGVKEDPRERDVHLEPGVIHTFQWREYEAVREHNGSLPGTQVYTNLLHRSRHEGCSPKSHGHQLEGLS